MSGANAFEEGGGGFVVKVLMGSGLVVDGPDWRVGPHYSFVIQCKSAARAS